MAAERATGLVGREPERAAIDRLLAGSREGRGGALVLRGEAGLGKSALLADTRDRADGLRVLPTVGVEPEIDLPFAALHRLLRPVLGHVERIPAVQADALRAALGLGSGSTDNRFVIALAALSLLAEVAVEAPVLCLVDDAHWLDQPSAEALSFMARRLEAERVAILFAARTGDPRAFAGAGLPDLVLDGLADPDADTLLVAGGVVRPGIRRAIRAAAGGNPLALLEIPHELTAHQLDGREPLPHPMPVGHDLRQVFVDRIARLPAPARTLLLVAAAEGSGAADVVLAAARELGVPATALVDLEAAGLLRATSGGLAFRHPVLRSSVYEGAGTTERRLAHEALAAVLDTDVDADRRAWHRAAPLVERDDGIADELEGTAGRARARGGHGAAAAALRRAAELTSDRVVRVRRSAAAARAAWDAGQADDALAMVRAVGPEAWVDDEVVAELRHVQGEIELARGAPLAGARLLVQGAALVADTRPSTALQMLFDAAMCANYAGDLGLMADVARRAAAVRLPAGAPEAPLTQLLGAVVAMVSTDGHAHRTHLVSALDGVSAMTEPRALVWAAAAAAGIGDRDREEALCARALSTARGSTAVGTVALVLQRIAWGDVTHSRVLAAAVHAREGLQLALEAGLTNSVCFHQAILAWVAALQGSPTTVAQADEAAETAVRHGLAPHLSIARWALGLQSLGEGRWEEAAERLDRMAGHPYIVRRALPDLVEAAVRAGRPELARSVAERLAAHTPETAPDWEQAFVVRCRALVAEAPAEKEALLVKALQRDDGDRRPFSRGRSLLLLGEHLRRERRRSEARPPLREAVEIFQRLGVVPWERRAAAELRATGETAGRQEEDALGRLTPQELQIAGLVAQGGSNKQVAAQLFLSRRTVDYHLRKVFVKLGISSRTELARLWLAAS